MSGKSHFGLKVSAITDIEAWRAIATEWNELLRATNPSGGLQSFEFLATWWECMAGDRRLWTLAFYDDDELAGIAPLQIQYRNILGKTYRVVEFLGMTEEILVPDFLFPQHRSRALRSALIDYLSEHIGEWDFIELDELSIDNPVIGDFEQLARRCRLTYRELPFHDCPFLDLSSHTAESYWRERSSKLSKNVRASERKLREFGSLGVRTYSSPEDVRIGFEEFMRIEPNSWKHKARVGIASDARYRTFYGRLLSVFAERHGARVMIITVGGQPIAGTFAILIGRVYYSLQIVHDERYSRCSPGTLLEYYEMTALLECGLADRYEFLGGALQNKLRWTSDAVATACIRARKSDLRTKLLDIYQYRAKPFAKRWLNRFGLFQFTPQTRAAAGAPK